jgi:hypothetical protein
LKPEQRTDIVGAHLCEFPTTTTVRFVRTESGKVLPGAMGKGKVGSGFFMEYRVSVLQVEKHIT